MAVLADACDTVRGVTMNRLAASLVGALVAIPLAILLTVLTVFGLLAAVGVLFLAMMAPLFVVGWLIPGIPRTIGLKWFQALLGCMIQSALIAALLGVVMVLGAILQAMIPHYGFWMVGLLNVVVMVMALRVRGMFENLTGMSHPAASGLMSSYVAMKTLGAVGRAAKGVGHAGAGAVGRTSRGVASTAGHGMGGYMNAGSRGLPQTTAASRGGRLRQHFAVPAPFPAATGGITPPYRTAPHPQTGLPAGSFAQTPQYDGAHASGGGHYAIPGRTVDALPTSAPRSRRALPAAVSTLASTAGAVTGKPPTPTVPAKRHAPSQPQAPARTFTSASTSHQGVVHSARHQTALPSRRNIQTPPRPNDPLVVTQQAKPVTPRAELKPRPRRDGLQ